MGGLSSPAGADLPRAVLLDMDDTLFDHSLTCRDAIRAVRRERPFLRRRSLEELWSDYTSLLSDAPGDPATGRSSQELRERRWKTLAASCGERLSDAGVRELSRDYRGHYQRLRRPVPGAVELVRRLHARVRVAVVTNNEVAEQEEKLAFLDLHSAVDALVVSEAVGASKPDPRIFREALRRVDATAESCVMVGDSWANDVLGARAVKIRPVWFNRFGLPRPDGGPAEEIRSFRPPRSAEQRLLRAPPGPGRS